MVKVYPVADKKGSKSSNAIVPFGILHSYIKRETPYRAFDQYFRGKRLTTCHVLLEEATVLIHDWRKDL